MDISRLTGSRPSRSDDRVQGLVLVAAMAAVMWVVEVIDAASNHSLDRYGIEPRDVSGLEGIVFSPFLHGSFGHLISNTVPFLVLGAVIALSGLVRVVKVTAIVGLVGGLGTWLVSSPGTVTIGASGIVFGYAAYLLARGFFSRSWLQLGVGLLVAIVWGGSLLVSLVPRDGVSWQAHLFGAIGGVVAARMLAPDRDERAARRTPSLAGR